jgi:hypothetical protein
LGLLGIGELERLQQESLGLKLGDHYHQDNNGRSLDRASSQKGLKLMESGRHLFRGVERWES